MMSVKDRIKVFYDKYKRWYPGTVEQIVQPGGGGAPRYGIQFDDGERTAHRMERCRPCLGMLPQVRRVHSLSSDVLGSLFRPEVFVV